MSRIRLIAATALLALTSLPALAQDAANPVVAKVNGTEITKSDLDLAINNLDPQMAQLPEEQKKAAAITMIVEVKLIAEKAKAEKLDENADFKRRVNFIVDRELHSAFLKKNLVDTVTEADARARYDKEVAALPPQAPVEEVRARHILVKEEADAKTIIKELEAGKDFAELAKEKSTDPNKSDGGDLGFFKKGMMVPEFDKAVFAMKKGEVSKVPVKTQFGYHVIKVEDTRTTPPPPLPTFEQVKDQITQVVIRDKYIEMMKATKAEAKIEIEDPALKKAYDEANKASQ